MHAEDVNRVVLVAVLHVIEAWVEEDRAAASLANGVLSRAERQSAVAQAREKRAQASQTLADRLPSQAHANLSAGLGAAAPRPNAPVGETVRRWGKPEHRLTTARGLLKAAAVAQRQADERAQFLDQLACSAVVNAIAWWKFNEKERLESAYRLVS